MLKAIIQMPYHSYRSVSAGLTCAVLKAWVVMVKSASEQTINPASTNTPGPISIGKAKLESHQRIT